MAVLGHQGRSKTLILFSPHSGYGGQSSYSQTAGLVSGCVTEDGSDFVHIYIFFCRYTAPSSSGYPAVGTGKIILSPQVYLLWCAII